MTRSPALRFSVLLATMALLLPLVAMADSCVSCLWAASPDCCPLSCCACCAHGTATLAVSPRIDVTLGEIGFAGDPIEDRVLPSAPRDVFHVPKRSLV